METSTQAATPPLTNERRFTISFEAHLPSIESPDFLRCRPNIDFLRASNGNVARFGTFAEAEKAARELLKYLPAHSTAYVNEALWAANALPDSSGTNKVQPYFHATRP